MSSLQKNPTFSVCRAVFNTTVGADRPRSPTFPGQKQWFRTGGARQAAWRMEESVICEVARPVTPNKSQEEARLHLQTLNLKTLRRLLDPGGFAQLLPAAIRGFSLVICYTEERGGVLPFPTAQPLRIYKAAAEGFHPPVTAT